MSTGICGDNGKEQNNIVTTILGRNASRDHKNLGNSSVSCVPTRENLRLNTKHGLTRLTLPSGHCRRAIRLVLSHQDFAQNMEITTQHTQPDVTLVTSPATIPTML